MLFFKGNITTQPNSIIVKIIIIIEEKIEFIISACPILTNELDLKRYDSVCVQLHFNLCKKTGVKLEKEHWCDNVPKLVQTSHEVKVNTLWTQKVQIDRTIPNNKSDIIIRENEKRNMQVKRCCNFWRQRCQQERS